MNLNSDHKKYIFTNIFIVALTAIIAIILYTIITKSIKDELQKGVSQHLSKISISIAEQLHYSVQDLISTSTIVVFKDDLTLDEYQSYAKNKINKLDDDFLLEWQPIILHKDRDSFEKRARNLGLESFYLWEPDENGKPIPAKKREEYVPVYYLLATHVDVNTLGLDLAFSPERMLSKYEARDVGLPKSSDFFERISNQKGDLNPISFAITLPVYSNGIIPTTIDERKESIKGYLAGVYSLSSLFDDLFKTLSKENFIISIYSQGNKELKFIQNIFNKPHKFESSTTIDVYGSTWTISLAVNDRYIDQHSSSFLYNFLVIPIMFGLLVLIFLRTLYKKNIQLNKTKNEFESIFNYAQDGIAIVNLDGDFLKCNQSFLNITGYTYDEILTKNCNELTTDEYKDINKKTIQKTIETGVSEYIQKACITKNNIEIYVTMSMSLLPNKKTILLIIQDTTALKLLQEQSKLASLGEMIGNIAHQWRQPLSLITSSIGSLKAQSDLGEEVTKKDITEYSEIINKQAQYLSDTIDNFRDFIKSDYSYKEINLKDAIENALNLVEASLKQNFINLVVDIEDGIKIYANSNELSQAFINILNNSKDVLKEKVEDEEDRLIIVTARKIASNKIQLSFKDSGGGIDSKIIDKVFEPYFTTKHAYIGTGLGLSIAYKILVERHEAVVSCRNQEFEYADKKYKGAEILIDFTIK